MNGIHNNASVKHAAVSNIIDILQLAAHNIVHVLRARACSLLDALLAVNPTANTVFQHLTHLAGTAKASWFICVVDV